MNTASKEQLENLANRLDWKEWSVGLLENRVYFVDFNTSYQYLELQFSTLDMLMEWLGAAKGETSPEKAYENMLE